MPTIDVSLGSLELECKESGWLAQVRNAATFAASEEGVLARLSQKLTEGVLTEYNDDMPWIARGHDFRLLLQLRFGTAISIEQQEVLTATLVAQFRTAKLWSQLCLAPNFVEASQKDRSCHKISISLDHHLHPPGQASTKLHKLDVDVPFQDLRPPPTIAFISMDTVYLDIRFERHKRRKRRRLNPRCREVQPLFQPSQDSLIRHDSIVTGFPSFSEYHEDQHREGLIYSREETSSHFAGSCFDDENEVVDFDDAAMFFEPEWEYSLIDEDTAEKIPVPLKRMASLSDNDYEPTASLGQSLLDLVDGALRISISGAPLRLPKGIIMTSSESLQHLAALAPSLWSPHYLPNSASRAVFHPTISHAIRAVRATARAASGGVQASADVSTLMWRMLCRGMFNRQAGRQLAPLSIATGDAPPNATIEFEMLDLHQVSGEFKRHEADEVYLNHLGIDLFMEDGLLQGEDDMLDIELLSVCDRSDLLEGDYEDKVYCQDDVTEDLQFWEELELLDC